MEWVASGAAGLAAAAFLSLLFKAVQARWPHSYYAVGDLASYSISLNPMRYVLFRFLPVVLVTLFAATTADRFQGSALLTGGIIAAAHIASTAGRAVFGLVRRGRAFAREVQLVVHFMVAGGIIGAAFLGTLASEVSWLQEVIPPVKELPLSLWTAAFAGFAGAFLVQFARRSSPSIEDLIKQSRSTIPDDIWKLASSTAHEEKVDQSLVKAILLVENLQRPEWVRRLERAKGRVFKHGTYGIMQVRTNRPIGDADSVIIAVRERLIGKQVVADRHGDRDKSLDKLLRSYNNDERFIELGKAFYYVLAPAGGDQESWYDDLNEELDVLIGSGVGFLLGTFFAAIVLSRRRTRRN